MLKFAVFALLAVSVPAFALAPQQVPPMAPDADPSYEVATIKPAQATEDRAVQVQGAMLVTRSTSLIDLMMFAYGVHGSQVLGGADWIRTDKIDLVMKPDLPGRPSTLQMRSILRKLLADRYQLTFHHAEKEIPIYAIVPARGGFKPSPTSSQSAASNTAFIGLGPDGMTVGNATLPEFASLLQRYVALDRPVVDETGIPGKFDFRLSWAPDPSQFNGHSPWPSAGNDTPLPSLYTAMQEQLGLRLEASKKPVEVMVIDTVAKPTAD